VISISPIDALRVQPYTIAWSRAMNSFP
jgi:hypothetical protein